MKAFWIVAAMTIAVIIGTSCHSVFDGDADVITGATTPSKHEKMILPPESDGYKVVGVVDGLKNYVIQYDDTLYRGGEPLADSASQSLKTFGVRTIISIVPTENERDFCRKNGFALVEIPFEKTTGPSSVDLERYINTIKNGAAPFYIHCHGGIHRGGVLGVAYRVHVQGWPYEKALVEYGRLGGNLLANHTMLESIRTL